MQTAPLGPETFCLLAHLVRVVRIAPPVHCVSVSSLSPELAWDKSFTGAQGRVPERQEPAVGPLFCRVSAVVTRGPENENNLLYELSQSCF